LFFVFFLFHLFVYSFPLRFAFEPKNWRQIFSNQNKTKTEKTKRAAVSGDGSRGGRMSQTLLQLGSSAVTSRGAHPGAHQGQMFRHGKSSGGMPGLEAALLQAARHQHGAQGNGGSSLADHIYLAFNMTDRSYIIYILLKIVLLGHLDKRLV
jgi:hypothetical protein